MNETGIIKIIVIGCGMILAGTLIGTWLYGVDFSSLFLGTPWQSPLEHTRGIIALEGGIVAITLLFGGLFLAGVIALIKKA